MHRDPARTVARRDRGAGDCAYDSADDRGVRAADRVADDRACTRAEYRPHRRIAGHRRASGPEARQPYESPGQRRTTHSIQACSDSHDHPGVRQSRR